MNWQSLMISASMRPSVKQVVRILGATIGLFLICLPAFSQGNAGRILGTLTDQSGGVLVGATVTITDTQRGTTRTLNTNQAGEYNSPNLLPSTYTIRAEAMGFKTIERVGILLEASQELRVDMLLQPGQQTQTITVSEALPMVDTTNAELGGTLQSDIIDSLPMNGRNFQNLLQLTPGVMIYPGGTSYSESTNGLRSHQNLYLVNGVFSSTPWDGQSVMNSSLHAGDAGTILPVDAIDELKTEENPRAEYGWKPGAIIDIGIKSGTNTMHGTAYAYGRDTALDARNYYDVATAPKAEVGLEQFGGTIGGPIKKDKLFFFANYEGQLYSIGNPFLHNFPVTTSIGDATKSLIDACNTALTGVVVKGVNYKLTALSAELAGLGGPSSASPCMPVAGQPSDGFLGFFPINPGPSTNVYTSIPSTNAIHGGLGKIDYHINDHNSLNGMYFFSQGSGAVVGDPTTIVRPEWLNQQYARAQAGLGSWTWTPSSTLVNEFRFGYSHYYQDFESNDHTLNPESYPFNGATYIMPTGITNPFYFGMPVISIGGLSNRNGIGQSIGPFITGPEGVLSFVDSVSILRGKHAFKVGVEIQSNRASEDITSSGKGPVSFGSSGPGGLVNFFIGNLRSASLLTGDPKRTISNQAYAAFFQDDWRVTPRLTVNAGIRYEIETVIKDTKNALGNFDPNVGLVQVGFGISSPYNGDHNNFAPRLGLAWDVFGNGKTVVRAAGGIVYESAVTYDVTNAVSNFLGLRTIPTGVPLYNNGSSTPLSPAPGNIDLSSNTYTASTGISTIAANWQAFDPTQPISSTNKALYAGATTTAGCGDGATVLVPSGVTSPPPCSIVGIDRNFRTPYVESWSLGIQRAITSNLSLDINYVGNHGVKLIGFTDVNQPQLVGGFSPGWGDPTAGTGTGMNAMGSAAYVCLNDSVTNGPFGNCSANGAAEQAARPFTAPCTSAGLFTAIGAGAPGGSGGQFNPKNTCLSYLADVTIINNSTMSNYNGVQVSLNGRNYHGLSFNAGYTYSHALADASDEGRASDLSVPINNYASVRSQLYMPTNYDLRHRATISLTYAVPGKKGYGQLFEGWTLNSVIVLQSGSPWGQSDLSTDWDGTGELNNAAGSMGGQWNFYGNPSDFTPVHGWTDTNPQPGGGFGGGLSFSGSDTTGNVMAQCVAADTSHFSGNQLQLALASLANIGCYAQGNSVLVPPPFGSYGSSGRNLWRDAGFKQWDLSVDKAIKFSDRFSAQFRAEFFNLINHPIFCNPNGVAGGANSTPGDPSGQPFGAAGSTPDVCASNPEIGSGGPRSIQLGLKLIF
jgi:Carboxypeptidase regulatory-like domain/TonB dependent receptor